MRAALERLVERQAARRRAAIAAALAAEGVAAVAVEGEDVRVSGQGLARRWWRELTLREAGRMR